MDVRKKLIELLDETFEKQYDEDLVITAQNTADHLIANGVTITPAVPGPREDNHNITELCFLNGK